jgi:hypothetical protein
MPKLALARIFRPDVSVAMTAMNDRITIERLQSADGGQSNRIAETLPLVTDADGKRLEDFLNQCLREPEEEAEPAPAPEPSAAPAPEAEEPKLTAAIPSLEESTAGTGQQEPGPAPPQPETSAAGDSGRRAPEPVEIAPEPALIKPELEKGAGEWMLKTLKGTATLSSDEINCHVFEALHTRFNCPVINNEHDFPAFVLEGVSADSGATGLELVLTPHYLLGNYPFGYVRFGPETRLFLKRLDDYVVFPHAALRGAVQAPSGAVLFVTSDEFSQFLRTHSERSYKMHFATVLTGIGQLSPEHDLVWPLAPEERLFQATSVAAAAYGLPVQGDAIVLDPNVPEFIGFKRSAPQGMELRDGEDFVRFTPEGVQLSDEGQTFQFSGGGVLLGWALDQDGRVCALYRKSSGFIPPPGTKLLRFLSEEDREREQAGLSVLAELGHEGSAPAA